MSLEPAFVLVLVILCGNNSPTRPSLPIHVVAVMAVGRAGSCKGILIIGYYLGKTKKKVKKCTYYNQMYLTFVVDGYQW